MKRKMKQFLGILLSLALALGLMPGMSLTAYAAEFSTLQAGDVLHVGDTINSTTEYKVGGSNYLNPNCKPWTLVRANVNEDTVTEAENGSHYLFKGTLNGNPIYLSSFTIAATDASDGISVTSVVTGGTWPVVTFAVHEGVAVTGVTLNPSTAQTINVDGKVSFTATVQPDNASDKKVKWSVVGTNSGAVKLYSDVDCKTEVGTDAVETLTVYAKGMSVGTATVKVESNADSTKSASCEVAVNNPAATITKAPTAKALTYTGSPQELVTAGVADGGEMQYALGTETEATEPYTTSIPKATNAGTYYVWYKVVGDEDHTDSEPSSVTVTIEEQKQNKDEAVANVIDLINKLPSPSEVTANDKEQIEAARAAYDALTDEQKSQISEETLKKLTDIEASLAEVLKNTGDTQQNPDGTKTVTKENADGKTISVTNYSKTDEQISQFIFKKAKGTTVDLTNVNSKNLKTVVVPESVKANGNTYKVTRIRKGFLKNCKQATKVDIGKNINTIDKNAFNYGKKVKTVIIRGKLKKVGKGAFKNTKKNVIIKVQTNAKNFEKNKKLLEKSGLPKNVTVKRVKNKK